MIDPQEAVFNFVRTVPNGKVVTYGQVADMVEGVALQARQVGGIMALCPEDVPWHRVIGAGGKLIIVKRSPHLQQKQHDLLGLEGITFLGDGRVDMGVHQWNTFPNKENLFSQD